MFASKLDVLNVKYFIKIKESDEIIMASVNTDNDIVPQSRRLVSSAAPVTYQLDPSLSLTPEKSSLATGVRRTWPAVEGRGVRFNQTVNVHHISPVSSSKDDSSLDTSSKDDSSLETSSHDESSFDTSSRDDSSLDTVVRKPKNFLEEMLTIPTDLCLPEPSRSSFLRSTKDVSVDVNDSCPTALSPFTGDMSAELSQPEMNSTLRVCREISDLKKEEFSRTKLNEKMKNVIQEKAYNKVNAPANQYSELVSLDLKLDDLKVSVPRVKAATGDVNKAEKLLPSPPDIMEFYTSDLEPEYASYELYNIPPETFEFQTTELRHGYDLYRHIRSWNDS